MREVPSRADRDPIASSRADSVEFNLANLSFADRNFRLDLAPLARYKFVK